MVIITDGVSNVNADNTIHEARKAKEDGAHIISIGVGMFDQSELQAIASEPSSKNAYLIDDFTKLAGLTEDLITATCRGML